ncbi:MAG: NPCBM/NEW2 domain-containing protein [Planctomycetales bacterium]
MIQFSHCCRVQSRDGQDRLSSAERFVRQAGELRSTFESHAPRLLLVAAFMTISAGRARGEDVVVLLDGTVVKSRVLSIDPTGMVALADGRNVELDGLREARRERKTSTLDFSQPKQIVELVGGGKILAEGIQIREQRCEISWAHGEPISLPLELLRAVRMQPKKTSPAFDAALHKPPEDFDLVFLSVNGKLQSLQGIVEGLDENSLRFEWQDKERSARRSDLHGIVLAAIGDPPDRAGQCLATLADGSSVWGKVLSLKDGKLSLRLGDDAEATLPWSAVARLQVRSSRMVFLSEQEPVEAVHQPIVTLPRPWRRDHSVGGKALALKGRVFEKGIGVGSRSLLKFSAGREYDLFAATIGIDDETKGRGDCVFVVRGDGKELLRRRVTGQDDPREIRIDIRGVSELELIVEPGADLDLADHADWCDARLIREKR